MITDCVGRHQLSRLIDVSCREKICKTWSDGMEWNGRHGIAKLLVGFEKKLHQCVPHDLFSSFCAYFLENMLEFLQISTETKLDLC